MCSAVCVGVVALVLGDASVEELGRRSWGGRLEVTAGGGPQMLFADDRIRSVLFLPIPFLTGP